jgi:hypothetical protein
MAMPSEKKPYDPLEALRGMRDATMEAWTKMMTDVVHTDAYAQSTGAMLDAYLTASAPFYQVMQNGIARALEQLNLPSRSDLASASERLTHIETRLDGMDANLHRVLAKQSNPAARRGAAPDNSRKEGK